jgi:hypothetical protein
MEQTRRRGQRPKHITTLKESSRSFSENRHQHAPDFQPTRPRGRADTMLYNIKLKLSISDKGSWRYSIGESECCCLISRGYIQL